MVKTGTFLMWYDMAGEGSLTMVARKPSIEIEQAPFLIVTLSALLNQVSLSENWVLFDCSEEKSKS